MVNQLAPVILFTYKRANFVKQVLDSLASNNLAKSTEVYVFANASSGKADKAAVKKTHKVLTKYENSFAEYHVIYREKHICVKETMIRGINEVFEKYDRVIVLEDDIITSTNFLDYMNGALDYYKKHDNVFSVCAYNCVALDGDCHEDTYLHKVFRSWGYGLWRDKFMNLDLSNSFENACMLKPNDVYNVAPSLYPAYMLYIMGELIELCLDADIMLYQLANGLTTVFPKESYCDCIDDGSGMHQIRTTAETSENNKNFKAYSEKTDFCFSVRTLESVVSHECFYRFVTKCYEWHLIKLSDNVTTNLNGCLTNALFLMSVCDVPADYYFKKYGYSKIAIYACGRNGHRFYRFIKQSEYVKVVFAMDKDEQKTLENVKMTQRLLPDEPVDAVVVTYTIDYLEICQMLKCNQPVVDMLSIIMESLLDHKVPQRLRAYLLSAQNEGVRRPFVTPSLSTIEVGI